MMKAVKYFVDPGSWNSDVRTSGSPVLKPGGAEQRHYLNSFISTSKSNSLLSKAAPTFTESGVNMIAAAKVPRCAAGILGWV